jgi:hypothetical protein
VRCDGSAHIAGILRKLHIAREFAVNEPVVALRTPVAVSPLDVSRAAPELMKDASDKSYLTNDLRFSWNQKDKGYV